MKQIFYLFWLLISLSGLANRIIEVDSSDVEINNSFSLDNESVDYEDEVTDYMDVIKYDKVFENTSISSKLPVIAIIDTGIDIDHPGINIDYISDLSCNISTGEVVRNNGISVIDDEDGHGTEVAGVVFEMLKEETFSSYYLKQKILIIKVNTNKHGALEDKDVINAINYAIDNDADIINMSFSSVDYINNPFVNVLEKARRYNVKCVAAAGNESTSQLSYPAADPNVIGVGSVDNNTLELASYSNYGDNVDICAPGTVRTTKNDGTYAYVSGTSYSAPIISTLIALQEAYNSSPIYMDTKDGLVPIGLYNACKDLGETGKDAIYGYGLVDAYSLIKKSTIKISFETGTTDTVYHDVFVSSDKGVQYLPTPTRIYHKFDGWYFDSEFIMPVTLSEVISGDVTLYAKWITEKQDKNFFTYKAINETSIAITGYTGDYINVTVPSVIDGKVVTEIADYAFASTNISKIHLPITLTKIGNYAFDGSRITEITLPEGLISIGEYAFNDCVYLREVFLSDSIESIGEFAFANTGIEKIELPDNLTTLKYRVLFNCINLKTIYIGKNTSEIVIYKTFHDDLGYYDLLSFVCPKLEEVIVDIENNSFSSLEGILYDKTINEVVLVPQKKDVKGYTLPVSVTAIGDYSFYKSNLETINLENLLVVKKGAFKDSNLISVLLGANTDFRENIFEECKYLAEITFAEGFKEIPKNLLKKSYVVTINLPSTLEIIHNQTFLECFYLKYINLPINANLVIIGKEAFKGCISLEEFNFTEKIAIISESAFEGCSLNEITLNEELQSIGVSAFEGCPLNEISLNENLKTIDDFAFGNTNITSLSLPSSIEILGNNIVRGSSKLESITISNNPYYATKSGVLYSADFKELISYPAAKKSAEFTILNSVEKISSNAFYNSINLINIVFNDDLLIIDDYAFYESSISNIYYGQAYKIGLPLKLEYIGDYAFSNSKLYSICQTEYTNNGISYKALPESIEYIGKGAFSGLFIEGVTLPSKMKSISNGMFSGCESLNYVGISENLEIIGNSAFSGCKSLRHFTFTDNIKKIGIGAFYGSSLVDITLNDGLEFIEDEAFSCCYNLKSVIIPDSVVFIGDKAFYECTNLSDLNFGISGEDLFIGAYAFSATNLSTITLPSRIASLGISAFDTVEEIIFSSNSKLEEIKDDTFVSYSSLEKISFGENSNLKIIGKNAFKGLISLQTVDLSNTKLEEIQESAFTFCRFLENISLPSTLTTIRKNAFYGNMSLKNLYLYENIDYIGPHAFYGAYDLNIYFKIPSLGANFKENWDSGIKGYTFNVSGFIEIDDFKLAKLIDDNYMVVSYSGDNKVIDLNNINIDGNISSIAPRVFESKQIDRLILSEHMKLIDAFTFENINISEIYIPASIKVISRDAFRNSTISKVVFAPDSTLQRIESNAFRDCNLLKSFDLPKSVTEIYDHAFFNSALSTINIPDESNLNTISNYAFAYSKLSNVVLPQSLTLIGYGAFRDCKLLQSVEFNSDELKLQNEAFYNTGLIEVNIPNGIYYIGDYAFTGIPNLIRFNVSLDNEYFSSDEYGVLYNKNQTILLSVPATRTEDYNIPNTIEIINTSAFENSNIENITFEEGSNISNISNRAFFGSKIKRIVIPNHITLIDVFAFAYCQNLECVIFEEGSVLYKINEGAFYGCTKLEEFYLPKTCLEIDTYAFYGCHSITEEIFKYANPYKIKDFAFAQTGVKELDLKVSQIGSYAFSDCKRLENIRIEGHDNRYNEISANAFNGCNNLKTAYFGEKIHYIALDFFILNNLSLVQIDENNNNYSSNNGLIIYRDLYIDELIFINSDVQEIYISQDINLNLDNRIITKLNSLYQATIECEISTEQIINFLSLENLKNIYIHETFDEWVKRSDLPYNYHQNLLPNIYLLNKDNNYSLNLEVYIDLDIDKLLDFNQTSLKYIKYDIYCNFSYDDWKINSEINFSGMTNNSTNVYFYNDGNYELFEEVVVTAEDNLANRINGIKSLKKATVFGVHDGLLDRTYIEELVCDNNIEWLFSYNIPTSLKKITYLGTSIDGDFSNIDELYISKETILRNGFVANNLYYMGTLEDWMNSSFSEFAIYHINNLYVLENGEYKLLEHVVIPGSISTIKTCSLRNINSIKSIEVLEGVKEIEANAIRCPNLVSVIINGSDTYLREYAISSNQKINVKIPTMHMNAFGSTEIKELTITSNNPLNYVPENVEKIYIPKNLLEISSVCFNENNVGAIYYEGSVLDWLNVKRNSYGGEMVDFYILVDGEFQLLEELIINGDEYVINEYQFANIKSLKYVKLTGNTNVSDGVFNYSDNITTFDLHLTQTTIFYSLNYSGSDIETLIISGNIPSHFFIYTGYGAGKYIENLIIKGENTIISDGAFSENNGIKKVLISEDASVEIGSSAFSLCENLEEVVIAGKVLSIGTYVFESCNNLINVDLGENLTIISSGMFSGCSNIRNLNISNSVTELHMNAFDGIAITDFVVPEGVERLYIYNAIYDDYQSITIPKSVTYIKGNFALRDAISKDIYYKGTIEDWCNIEFYDRYSNPITSYSKLWIDNELVTNLNIVNEKINSYAFYGYKYLDSVYLENVEINDYAFSKSMINELTFGGTNTTGNYAFSDILCINKVVLAERLTQIPDGYQAFANTIIQSLYNKTDIEISLSYKETNNPTSAYFLYNKNNELIESGLIINDFVFQKDYYGYYYLSGYQGNSSEITLPIDVEGNTYVVEKMFSNEYVEKINIKSNIEIKDSAFSGFKNLKTIEFNNSVTFNQNAFTGCEKLEEVYFDGSLTDWCGITFYNSTPMMYASKFFYKDNDVYKEMDNTLIIPNDVLEIKSYSFFNFDMIKTIIFNDNLTYISSNAFANCDGLLEVEIPINVKTVSSNAFADCLNLTKVILNNSYSLNNTYSWSFNSIFSNCSIKEITLENISSLSSNEFANLSSLEKITINGTLETLPSGVLCNNPKLKEIYLCDSILEIKGNAFSDCESLEILKLPSNLVRLYSFSNCPKLMKLVLPDTIEYYNSLPDNIKELTVPVALKYDSHVIDEFRYPTDLVKLIVTKQTDFTYRDIYNINNLLYLELQNAKKIEYGTINYCPNLKHVILSDKLEVCSVDFITDCPNLEYMEREGDLYISSFNNPYFIFCGSSSSKVEELDLTNSKFINIFEGNNVYADKLFINKNIISITNSDSYNFRVNNIYFDGSIDEFLSIKLDTFRSNSINLYVKNGNANYELVEEIHLNSSNYQSLSNVSLNLKRIYIDSNIDQIYHYAEEIYYGGSLAQWCNITLNNFNYRPFKLYYIENGNYKEVSKELIIPEGVEKINQFVFHSQRIVSVQLPSTLNTLYDNSFYNIYIEKIINYSDIYIDFDSEIGRNARYIDNKGDIITQGESIIIESGFMFELRDGIYYLVEYFGTDEILILPENVNGFDYILGFGSIPESVKELVIPNILGIEESALIYSYNLEVLTIPYVGSAIDKPLDLIDLFSKYSYDGKTYKLREVIVTHAIELSGSQFSLHKDGRFKNFISLTIPKTAKKLDGFNKINNYYISLTLICEITNNSYISIDYPYINDGTSNILYIDDFIFMKNTEGDYDLIRYLGNDSIINLPETDFNYKINSYAIVIHEDNQFDINKINIPNNVTHIDFNFIYQSGYEDFVIVDEVVIPESVVEFKQISYIKKVIVNSRIENYTGQFNNEFIEEVYINNAVQVISDSFKGEKLAKVVIEEGAVLESVSDSFIGSYLFNSNDSYVDGCLYLANALISINETRKHYILPDGYIISNNAFSRAENLLYYEGILNGKIPENVKYLKINQAINKPYIDDRVEILILTKYFFDINSISLHSPQNLYIEHEKDNLNWDEESTSWNWKYGIENIVYMTYYEIMYLDMLGNYVGFDVLKENEIIKTPIYVPENNEIYSYEFIGWDFDSDGVVDVIPATIAIDTVAVAILEQSYTEYKVNYYDKDNKTIIASQTYHYNDVLELAESPMKKGYEFTGWLGVEEVKNVTSDLNIYSSWQHIGEHNYVIESYIEPTCYESGGNILICDICDEYIFINEIYSEGHNYKEEVILPTCYDKGYTIFHCQKCDYEFIDHYVRKYDHLLDEWVVKVEPTCSDFGLAVSSCLRCHVEFEKEIEPIYHEFTKTIVIEPTCTSNGLYEYHCSVCDNRYIAKADKIKHNYHEVVLTDEVHNILKGKYKYIYIYKNKEKKECINVCIDCFNIEKWSETYSGIYLSSAGCNHNNLSEWIFVIEPTCQTEGYKEKICSSCDTVVEVQLILPLPHHLETYDYLAPTCDEYGHNEYEKCIYCDLSTYQKIDPLGHDLISFDGLEPSCLEDGYYAYETCRRCDHNTFKVYPALGHEIIYHDGLEPTCQTTGYKPYETCSRCDYNTYEIILELGHDYSIYTNIDSFTHAIICSHDNTHSIIEECKYSEWEKITDPEEFKNGLLERHCLLCSNKLYEEIPMLHKHSFSDEYIIDLEPTCTKDGLKSYHCTNPLCDVIDNVTIIPALGHDLIYHEGKKATCITPGFKPYEACLHCDYTTFEVIQIGEHDLVYHEGKAPNCVSIGWEDYETCNYCNYTTFKPINSLGHDLIYHEGKEPTCTQDGYKPYETCSRCQLNTYKDIAALGHKLSEDYKHDSNYHWHTCLNCNSYTIEHHKFSEWEVVQEPSTESEGLSIRSCHCGYEEYKNIPCLEKPKITAGCTGSIADTLLSVITLGCVIVYLKSKRRYFD